MPPAVLFGEHVPCTTNSVREMKMQRCSLIRKSRKRGPDVWLLRWSDKATSGKRIYRKRVIGSIEEYADVDSVRRGVASLIERINADNPRIGLRSTTISALSSHFERCELALGNTWQLLHEEVLCRLSETLDRPSMGKVRIAEHQDHRSRILASSFTTREE